MAVQSPTAPIATRPTMVRLAAYVDAPLTEVVDRLDRVELDSVLADAVAGAVSPRLAVAFQTGDPLWESGAHVLIPVTWTARGPHRTAAGSGSVSLLAVRSGREGVTEVLADLTAPPESHQAVARVTRCLLDGVAQAIEAA